MEQFNKAILDQYVKDTPITCEKHPTEDLYIYGYYPGLSKQRIIWDEVNKHCRGLIIDGKGNAHARPFTKFFTFKEYVSPFKIKLSDNQILRLPKGNFKIYEKVDGTMATLYWVGEKPVLATQRSFSNEKARIATEILYEKYAHTFNKLKRDRTYVFEAIYPECKVLIDYGDKRDLVLIGVIDNCTGEDLPLEDIGFPIAKDYTQEYGHIVNFEEIQQLDIKNMEGFVLVYPNCIRIKLKFPWFIEAHKLMSRIISHFSEIYTASSTLADMLNKRKKYISNFTIWEHMKAGKPIGSLLQWVPEEYYYCGFEHWIKSISEDFERRYHDLAVQNNGNQQPDREKIWDFLQPDADALDVFKVEERRPLPENNSVMWKWMERFEKWYD
ncbi:MAG: hypothetical protein J5I94_18300 [Phaeodactylibacter sp.]|nr:hypothetical protein [Phaeodactylibacter sp.]